MKSPLPPRYAFCAVLLTLIFTVTLYLQRHGSSLGCHPLARCGKHASTTHRPELPAVAKLTELTDTATGRASVREDVLLDGTRRYTRQSPDADNATTLFLVLTKDAHSWGQDLLAARRTADDFVRLLVSTGLDLTTVSLGVLTADTAEYDHIITATSTVPLARVTVFYRPDHGLHLAYGDRHQAGVQYKRRGFLAGMRNYLMLRALQDEAHIVWLDADVFDFSPAIVQTMIRHAESDQDRGIITARCKVLFLESYDNNAWAVDASVPGVMGAIDDAQRDYYAQRLIDTRRYIPDVIKGTTDDDVAPLDSVGGTILYVRAELVRQGVNFPTFMVVGTTWKQDGWTGQETEGICYTAAGLPEGVRSRCWVLGGNHHVRHADRAFWWLPS